MSCSIANAVSKYAHIPEVKSCALLWVRWCSLCASPISNSKSGYISKFAICNSKICKLIWVGWCILCAILIPNCKSKSGYMGRVREQTSFPISSEPASISNNVIQQKPSSKNKIWRENSAAGFLSAWFLLGQPGHVERGKPGCSSNSRRWRRRRNTTKSRRTRRRKSRRRWSRRRRRWSSGYASEEWRGVRCHQCGAQRWQVTNNFFWPTTFFWQTVSICWHFCGTNRFALMQILGQNMSKEKVKLTANLNLVIITFHSRSGRMRGSTGGSEALRDQTQRCLSTKALIINVLLLVDQLLICPQLVLHFVIKAQF